MKRDEFLDALNRELSGLSEDEAAEIINYYDEMIDDRIEDGMTESEAVAAVGPIEEIVAQTLGSAPLGRLVYERVKPKKPLRVWEIVLIIIGSPLWISVLAAAFAIALSAYAVLWSLAAVVWAVCVSCAAAALGAVGCGVLLAVKSGASAMGPAVGAALVCAGGAILLFLAAKAASAGMLKLSKKLTLWIKSLFIKRSDRK